MNKHLSPVPFGSLYWRGLIVLLLFLSACAAPATPVIQDTPVPPQATPVPPQDTPIPLQVALAVQTDQQEITVGNPVAIVMSLNPPAAIAEATWTVVSGEGNLEKKTDDVVVFTPSQESDLAIIKVQGKTEAGLAFEQKITFRVIGATDKILVTQDTLQDGQTVPCENFIKGTYAETVTDPIWPVIYVGARFHFQDINGEAPPMHSGKWSDTVRFGDCTRSQSVNAGVPFQLLIVTAGPDCQAQIADYFLTARARGFPGVSGLADDCQEVVDRIVVTRE